MVTMDPNSNYGLTEYIDDVSKEVIQWINIAYKET